MSANDLSSIKKLEKLELKKLVDQSLADFFNNTDDSSIKNDENLTTFYNRIKDFTLGGGKRFRPCIAIAFYFGKTNKIDEKIINASLSLELIQTYLLIQDDIMDKDDLRRGNKSFHKTYQDDDKFKDKRDIEHFSHSIGILGGDFAFNLAIDSLIKSGFDNDLILKSIIEINDMVKLEILGQTQDIILQSAYVPTEDKVISSYKLKTVPYTTSTPAILGLILSNSTQDELDKFRIWGEYTGLAFQLIDDLLGIFGDVKKIGKPVCSDITEGKHTLLTIRAINTANDEDKNFILDSMGKDLDDNSKEKIKNIISKTGAKDSVLNDAKAYIKKAIEILEKSSLNVESKKFLIHYSNYMVDRDF